MNVFSETRLNITQKRAVPCRNIICFELIVQGDTTNYSQLGVHCCSYVRIMGNVINIVDIRPIPRHVPKAVVDVLGGLRLQ